jgi:hypothetical protein
MNQTTTIVIVVVIVVALLAFRIYRAAQEQRWSITGMWVVPAIFFLFTLVVVGLDVSSTIWVIPAALGGLVVGLGIGLYQGNHTKIRVDAAARRIFIKISPIGTLIFLAVIALRIGLRFLLVPTALAHSGAAPSLALSPEASMVSGALLALAVGMLIGLRIYVQRIYNAQAAGA